MGNEEFTFVGGDNRRQTEEIKPEDILAEVEIGDRKVMAVKAKYKNKGGGWNYVVKLIGIGNPTTFGAEKHVAWKALDQAITDHFIEIGQIAKKGD